MPAGTAASLQRLRQYSHLFTRYRRAYLLGLTALLLTNAIYMSIPRVLGAAIDALRAGTDRPTLLLYAGGIVVLAAAQSVVRVASRMYVLGISRRVDNRLKGLLHDKLVRLSPSFFEAVRTGDLMSRMTNDVTLVRALAGPGVLYFVNALTLYGLAIVYMATLSWQLTVLVMLPLPVMAWFVRGMVQEIKQYTLGSREALSHLNTVVQENLTGVQVVKAFALERAQVDKFEAASHEYVGWSLKEAWVRAKMVPLVGMAGGVSSVAVLGVGGWMVVRGTLSLGDLVAFLSYVTMLVFPTVALGWILSLVQRGAAALDRVDEVLQAPETIREPAPVRAVPASPSEDGGPDRDGHLSGSIRVRDLTFSYGAALAPYQEEGSMAVGDRAAGAEAEAAGAEAPNGRRHALLGIDLEAAPGSYVALVGRVGSGKTTLLKALLRLVEVPAGTVFVDGVDVTEMEFGSFRPHMGYVPQDDFLFSTTIGANIAFGEPAARREAIEEAARQAGVAEDVERFPRGYDTGVGERGLTLSGGQRQRVALARALLVDPDVLVLDNALSHVDSDTERRILRRLRERRGLRTVIASSNRLTAVRDADRIYVMDAGRVVASGTHEELIRRGGLYADMHEQQRLTDRLERL